MISGIAAAIILASLLLILTRKLAINPIPIYLLTGILFGYIADFSVLSEIIGEEFFDEEILFNLIYIGLGIAVFFSASNFVLRKEEERIDIDTVKSSMAVISFSLITGFLIFSYIGFEVLEASILSITLAFGSSMANSSIINEETRKDHIYGDILERMNIFEDILIVLVLVVIYSLITGGNPGISVLAASLIVSASLILRKRFSDIMKDLLEGKNEAVMLLGITLFIGLTLMTESLGLTGLTGIVAAGLLLADTDIGFEIRERLSSIKDFFTALGFISIGTVLYMPTGQYLIAVALITVFTLILRPILISLTLHLEGYDLRTSFIVSTQSNQVSEISVLGALILAPFISVQVISAITLSFAIAMVISVMIERHGHRIFETVFSNYEIVPEKTELPEELENHIIIAGFDHKTEQINELIPEEHDTVVIDYSPRRINRADDLGLYHILGDLNSLETWRLANYKKSLHIISAVSEKDTLRKIRDLETDSNKIIVDREEDGELIDMKLGELISEEVKKEEKE